jgi:2'-5' RNA ligase
MRRLRTFIAVELGGSVVGKAVELIRQVRALGLDANWVQPDQMHLTLKFLGELQERDVVDVCRVVAEAAAAIEPFEITFRGLGAFPSLEQPKTLWLGVSLGAEELTELQAAIEEGLHREMRFAKERRLFTPHLTLGRVKNVGGLEESLSQWLVDHADYDADLSVVEEVTTFASHLGRQGPTYEPLAHAALGGE